MRGSGLRGGQHTVEIGLGIAEGDVLRDLLI